MSIISETNAAKQFPERLEELTLEPLPFNPETGRGGDIICMLQPRKGWRERAAEGIASMQFMIKGTAFINERTYYIDLSLPATKDNRFIDVFGKAADGRAFLRPDKKTGRRISWYPQVPRGGFDAAGVAIDGSGTEATVARDENGNVIYTEPEIEGFNLFYGTLAMIGLTHGLTLKLAGVSLTKKADKDPAPNGRPYVRLHAKALEVVPFDSFKMPDDAIDIETDIMCGSSHVSEAAQKDVAAMTENI